MFAVCILYKRSRFLEYRDANARDTAMRIYSILAIRNLMSWIRDPRTWVDRIRSRIRILRASKQSRIPSEKEWLCTIVSSTRVSINLVSRWWYKVAILPLNFKSFLYGSFSYGSAISLTMSPFWSYIRVVQDRVSWQRQNIGIRPSTDTRMPSSGKGVFASHNFVVNAPSSLLVAFHIENWPFRLLSQPKYKQRSILHDAKWRNSSEAGMSNDNGWLSEYETMALVPSGNSSTRNKSNPKEADENPLKDKKIYDF